MRRPYKDSGADFGHGSPTLKGGASLRCAYGAGGWIRSIPPLDSLLWVWACDPRCWWGVAYSGVTKILDFRGRLGSWGQLRTLRRCAPLDDNTVEGGSVTFPESRAGCVFPFFPQRADRRFGVIMRRPDGTLRQDGGPYPTLKGGASLRCAYGAGCWIHSIPPLDTLLWCGLAILAVGGAWPIRG